MSDQPHKPAQVPLVSEFATDPEMAELVSLFLNELPARLETLSASWRKRDLREVQRLAHQLKGASAGYGFPTIGLAASLVENQLRTLGTADAGDQLAAIGANLNELTDLCRRAIGRRPSP